MQKVVSGAPLSRRRAWPNQGG